MRTRKPRPVLAVVVLSLALLATPLTFAVTPVSEGEEAAVDRAETWSLWGFVVDVWNLVVGGESDNEDPAGSSFATEPERGNQIDPNGTSRATEAEVP